MGQSCDHEPSWLELEWEWVLKTFVHSSLFPWYASPLGSFPVTLLAFLCLSYCKKMELAKAAIVKCHRLGGLNNPNLFSHDSGGWKSEIKSVSRVGFLWGPPPGLAEGCPLLFSRGLPSVCVRILTCSSSKALGIGFGPILMMLYLSYLFKGPVSKYVTFWNTGDTTTIYEFCRGWGNSSTCNRVGVLSS